jgi:hypothetical protein
MEDIDIEMKNACLVCHGKLTPRYGYIAKLRKLNEEEAIAEKEF